MHCQGQRFCSKICAIVLCDVVRRCECVLLKHVRACVDNRMRARLPEPLEEYTLVLEYSPIRMELVTGSSKMPIAVATAPQRAILRNETSRCKKLNAVLSPFERSKRE